MNKWVIAVAVCLASVPSRPFAETLLDAIQMAYQTNPSLRAQRAQLQAVDEGYVQARAGYGPRVSVTGQVAYQDARVQQPGGPFSPQTTVDYRARTESVDLSLVQPVYTAGATRAGERAAAADVLANRQNLRQAESKLLQNVITAYVDVRRDRETLRILKDEIVALTGEFRETQAKGKLGQLTRTDVAQSEARLLSAQAQLNLAEGRLNASNAEYLNVVGENPGDLEPEPDLPGMPNTVDEAFDAADHNNAQLLAAVENERGAREKVNEAKAANGPTLSLKVDASVAPIDPYLSAQYDKNIGVAAVVTQPLYTSGLNSSRVRQALDDDNRYQLAIEATRRDVVQQVAQAWDQLVSTQSALAIEARQVEVQQVAVQGNRIEERVGLRQTIDLLNAELELADARLGLVQSRHDEYLARAALVAAMGLLEVRYLTPPAQTFSPTRSLARVKDQGAPPWDGAIAALDGVAAPSTPPPNRSSPGAGAKRPANMPPLPTPVP